MQIIELYIRGYKRLTGNQTNHTTNNTLFDDQASFIETANIGDIVFNLRTNESATITLVDTNTLLTISANIFTSGNFDPYIILSDYEKVDLFKDESISITDSLMNLRDIKKVFTAFSQQFTLPASKTNNKLFRHYENQDVQNSFDARFRQDAIIKLNGVDYKKGKIQFKSVKLKNNKAYSYKVVFYSNTVELKELLGNTLLEGLEYDGLDFEYTESNIRSKLVANNSDIVVPNIHHSKNMRLTDDGYRDYITGDELSYVDFKPAIKLLKIIEAIERTFPQINFTGFFQSNPFQRLYMWLHRNAGFITNADEGGSAMMIRNRFRSQNDAAPTFTFNSQAGATIDRRVVTIDGGNTYGGAFVGNKSYLFQVITTCGTSELYTVRIVHATTGQLYAQNEFETTAASITEFDFNTTNYGNGYWGVPLDLFVEIESNNTLTISQSVVVRLRTKFQPWSSPITRWTANYTATQTSIENTFFVGRQMPKMKVIDFLNGLFKMFNLVVRKVGDNIDVQRAADFMNQGDSYDITKYVDMSSSTVERIAPFDEMEFKFKSKKSFLVQYADEINGIPFAEEKYPTADVLPFDGDPYKVEVPFEKMMYERISNEDTNVQTSLTQGAFLNKEFQPTMGAPLILYCILRTPDFTFRVNGVTISPPINTPSNLGNSLSWYGNTRTTLNFGLEVDEFTGGVATADTNLFKDGYEDYVEAMFNAQGRMLKVEAYLPQSILLKYDLNDKFVISNKVYRINSIKTNLLTNKSKLELYNKDEFISDLENLQFAYLPRLAQINLTKTENSISISYVPLANPAANNITGYDIMLNDGLYLSVGNDVSGTTITGLDPNTYYEIGVRVKYTISGSVRYSLDRAKGITTNTAPLVLAESGDTIITEQNDTVILE